LVSSVPLTVEPSLWNRGVARALLVEAMAIFDRREVRHPGLFTWRADSYYALTGPACAATAAAAAATASGSPR